MPHDFQVIRIDETAPADWRARLEAHLLRLDPEARQSRFFGPMNDRAIAALVARARPRALVVFMPDGQIRAAAEIHDGEEVGTAEIAVSVEAHWQHRGLGVALTATATGAAAAMGCEDIRVLCQRRNLPMLRIAEGLAARTLPLADWALALFRLDPVRASARAG